MDATYDGIVPHTMIPVAPGPANPKYDWAFIARTSSRVGGGVAADQMHSRLG